MIPSFINLYVDNPERSATFYEGIFGLKPAALSPTFAMFVFPGNIKLGLWSRDTVEPTATGSVGLFEVAVPLGSAAEVDEIHGRLVAAGHTVLQKPTDMDFGRTFVIADPDGHRLRFYNPPV
ncbi:MAG: VOC family protein [Allorhizobium sp.]